jgi:hypothetical protein
LSAYLPNTATANAAHYVIYHLEGHQVGCTADIQRRAREHQNGDRGDITPWDILEVFHGTAQAAGDREWLWADRLGYPRGKHYAESRHGDRALPIDQIFALGKIITDITAIIDDPETARINEARAKGERLSADDQDQDSLINAAIHRLMSLINTPSEKSWERLLRGGYDDWYRREALMMLLWNNRLLREMLLGEIAMRLSWDDTLDRWFMQGITRMVEKRKQAEDVNDNAVVVPMNKRRHINGFK